ncbi:hypothetical protein T484DRAFT_1755061 [Baffinella frigidus]|nr:hypothetical protein T484DRAFT_1755061 [Cryptophyta sp. CCMP2293]
MTVECSVELLKQVIFELRHEEKVQREEVDAHHTCRNESLEYCMTKCVGISNTPRAASFDGVATEHRTLCMVWGLLRDVVCSGMFPLCASACNRILRGSSFGMIETYANNATSMSVGDIHVFHDESPDMSTTCIQLVRVVAIEIDEGAVVSQCNGLLETENLPRQAVSAVWSALVDRLGSSRRQNCLECYTICDHILTGETFKHEVCRMVRDVHDMAASTREYEEHTNTRRPRSTEPSGTVRAPRQRNRLYQPVDNTFHAPRGRFESGTDQYEREHSGQYRQHRFQ